MGGGAATVHHLLAVAIFSDITVVTCVLKEFQVTTAGCTGSSISVHQLTHRMHEVTKS